MANSSSGASRTAAQTAADLARWAKAIIRIIRAAIAGGLKAAAVAAVKEALPFLVKVILWVLFIFVLLPVLIFASLPNIFFGFDTSDTTEIMTMTTQAMDIGAAYLDVGNAEVEYMDSIVTQLVADYEQDGIVIDDIKITGEITEDDLYWLIAISSVSYQQDLSEMSAEDIKDFSISRIIYVPTLDEIVTGEGDGALTTRTLTVDFSTLTPEELMEELQFDDEAKNWSEVLHKTLSESDALEKYGDYFAPASPSYSGDGSYSGGVEYGDSYDNAIDISGFVSPGTKNNLDLVAYAIQAWENNWGYVWGTYGNVLTESLYEYKLEQYPDGVGNYAGFIEDNWLGRRTADCIGLIKGYGWLDTSDLKIKYGTNGVPDYGANATYKSSTENGSMDTMPEIPGLALWKDGHIGIYIGNGYAIEAMGTKYGVVKTEVAGRGWERWCKLPYIDYIEE